MPAFVAKGSFKNFPVLGTMTQTMNFIFVDRKKKLSVIHPAGVNDIAGASPPDNKRHSLRAGEQICRRQRMEGNTPIVRTYWVGWVRCA